MLIIYLIKYYIYIYIYMYSIFIFFYLLFIISRLIPPARHDSKNKRNTYKIVFLIHVYIYIVLSFPHMYIFISSISALIILITTSSLLLGFASRLLKILIHPPLNKNMMILLYYSIYIR